MSEDHTKNLGFDVCNVPVSVGDTVAYVVAGYSSMKIGTVAKITPKGFTISRKNTDVRVNRLAKQVAKIWNFEKCTKTYL